MNAKQRRLVRRAVNAYEAANLADLYGDPEAPATRPRVSRAAAALHDRAPGHRKPRRYPPPIGFAGARRDPAAYGKRCHECGRPAHGVEHNGPPVCKLHNTDIPF